jgi:hypothetical protein
MPEDVYPSKINGFRFLRRRELQPVATCWNFQTTEGYPLESAHLLLRDLPEDLELSYFDPEYGNEEAWIFVRRVGDRFFVKRARRGASRTWIELPFERVFASFASSPPVQKPAGPFASFTISSIPDHQQYEHTKEIA